MESNGLEKFRDDMKNPGVDLTQDYVDRMMCLAFDDHLRDEGNQLVRCRSASVFGDIVQDDVGSLTYVGVNYAAVACSKLLCREINRSAKGQQRGVGEAVVALQGVLGQSDVLLEYKPEPSAYIVTRANERGVLLHGVADALILGTRNKVRTNLEIAAALAERKNPSFVSSICEFGYLLDMKRVLPAEGTADYFKESRRPLAVFNVQPDVDEAVRLSVFATGAFLRGNYRAAMQLASMANTVVPEGMGEQFKLLARIDDLSRQAGASPNIRLSVDNPVQLVQRREREEKARVEVGNLSRTFGVRASLLPPVGLMPVYLKALWRVQNAKAPKI